MPPRDVAIRAISLILWMSSSSSSRFVVKWAEWLANEVNALMYELKKLVVKDGEEWEVASHTCADLGSEFRQRASRMMLSNSLTDDFEQFGISQRSRKRRFGPP